jgi:hypothetical protein
MANLDDTDFTGCGKSAFRRHSERSEESLLGLTPRKEGFLTRRSGFGMTAF